jgi:inhibitor of the pro-sigma K processing machinery
MITEIIFLIILIAIGAVDFKFILSISGTVAKIAVHFLAGWILLTIANFLPGINVPINLITLIISGFGGVTGTILLALFYLIF